MWLPFLGLPFSYRVMMVQKLSFRAQRGIQNPDPPSMPLGLATILNKNNPTAHNLRPTPGRPYQHARPARSPSRPTGTVSLTPDRQGLPHARPARSPSRPTGKVPSRPTGKVSLTPDRQGLPHARPARSPSRPTGKVSLTPDRQGLPHARPARSPHARPARSPSRPTGKVSLTPDRRGLPHARPARSPSRPTGKVPFTPATASRRPQSLTSVHACSILAASGAGANRAERVTGRVTDRQHLIWVMPAKGLGSFE